MKPAGSDPKAFERRPGASETMRQLGLLVHGPAQWSKPAASRQPGIFVVELPAAPDAAPIDVTAVRRWIERVPTLTLAGDRPSPQLVATWLAQFWLPREPILFVGRSSRAIGARIAAIYATPLGDARPSSAGHWLKALSPLRDLRLWWAETDAHEEYEDALLDEVAARNDGAPLPFANIPGSEHERLRELKASLRAGTDAATPSIAARAPAKPRRATARKATGAPKPRATQATAKPPAAPTYVSSAGLSDLEAELQQLREIVRPEVIARVKAARELGDLRENADYEYARKEQSFVEGRIRTLEQRLRTAVVIEKPLTSGVVHLGSTVEVEMDGQVETYVIVGSTEADPSAGRLSDVSPVGRALMGSRVGDEVPVQLPVGSISYRVLKIA